MCIIHYFFMLFGSSYLNTQGNWEFSAEIDATAQFCAENTKLYSFSSWGRIHKAP